MVIVTDELLKRARSEKGGYTRAQLAAVGVKWPPKKGWPKLVLGKQITDEQASAFLGKKRNRVEKVRGEIEPTREIAAAYGMELNVKPLHVGKWHNAWHFMFNDADTGKRLMDWWPTKGTWRCPITGETGSTVDVEEAVQTAYAARLAHS